MVKLMHKLQKDESYPGNDNEDVKTTNVQEVLKPDP